VLILPQNRPRDLPHERQADQQVFAKASRSAFEHRLRAALPHAPHDYTAPVARVRLRTTH
jgi:hypothetical protein